MALACLSLSSGGRTEPILSAILLLLIIIIQPLRLSLPHLHIWRLKVWLREQCFLFLHRLSAPWLLGGRNRNRMGRSTQCSLGPEFDFKGSQNLLIRAPISCLDVILQTRIRCGRYDWYEIQFIWREFHPHHISSSSSFMSYCDNLWLPFYIALKGHTTLKLSDISENSDSLPHSLSC